MGVGRFCEQTLRRSTVLREGTVEFEELRDCILRNTDRSVLISSNCFARATESLRAASSSWSLVAFYYSSFFAAKAVLGMLGCWFERRTRWIDVEIDRDGSQALCFSKSPHPAAADSGTHRQFWHVYYAAVPPLQAWVSQSASLALAPVSGSDTWFIEQRNDVNYKPEESFALMVDFRSKYDPQQIPACLPGRLNTAYRIAKAFLELSKEISGNVRLRTDVFMPHPDRPTCIRDEVLSAQPAELRTFAQGCHPLLEF